MNEREKFDTIVLGVGAVGSAATYHLAKRNHTVLGIERFNIPHGKGSSRGITRGINTINRERPEYVPIIERALELWEELQSNHDHQLLKKTGAVRSWPSEDHIGYRGTLNDAIQVCESYSISYEVLTASELNEQHPGFELPPNSRTIWQPNGGLLDPQECIIAHVNQAHNHGAEIKAREKVEKWKPTSDGVIVLTNKDEYKANNLVITAGAWLSDIVNDVENVTAKRAYLGWFRPKTAEKYDQENFPYFCMDTENGYFYGTPAHRLDGVKVGGSFDLRNQQTVNPDTMDRTVSLDEEKELRRFLNMYLPDAAGATLRTSACMVTDSDDMQYIIDTHTHHPQVYIAGGFSGSGFMSSSAVGEIISELVTEEEVAFDLEPFAMNRF